jgi:hypothetical protein
VWAFFPGRYRKAKNGKGIGTGRNPLKKGQEKR